jgi:asparagine synthase (glutamine-hydrolysing)
MAMANTSDPLAQVLYTDLKTWLPGDILTKVDRASMAHSLEVRAPFLDHKFMEWAATLTSGLKLHRGTEKYILKRALEPVLPRKILYRTKQGFSMPLSHWFRGPLRTRVRNAVENPTLLGTEYFRRHEIERLVDEHEHGRRDHSPILWLLLVFEAFVTAREAA